MGSKYCGRKREERSHTLPHIPCQDLSSSSDKRKRVQEALKTFRDEFDKRYCQYKSNQLDYCLKTKVLKETAVSMQKQYQCENTKKRLGHVDGINVGDLFQYRAELVVIGLHHEFEKGIDYLGKSESSLATSIVATHKYSNVMKDGCLIYEGQGTNPRVRKPLAHHDQKLETGNLALWNSMNAKRPVRVILKISGKLKYDGLYSVDKMTQERGEFGKLVFKFVLNKLPDQLASVSLSPKDDMETETFQKRPKSRDHAVPKDIVKINDVSEGKEKFPIRVKTPTSGVELFKPFNYLVTMTSCINRVSQCGIQFELEIFKTESKGWGVRTPSFIPSGSFVCELVGEFAHHNNKNAESILHDANFIFNLGFGKGFIDATKHGNIGRFINHSCSPNLCVKDVMYDHNDKSVPHKMLFAEQDIPADRELSYNYNCFKRNFKVESNDCYCRSPKCHGQIYI
ncbi:histone-lysine N-methyltransferase, H3 lysine-9 specific SUVH5-like [Trifolium pratense]|uniref:histone-lysine N-methyltransferase, H3 lysine-9 specific SUVH5-like n=1 Tax=Trifolium pratense TaxID=57577 RepID=UPI001E692643|nr:histone-lysine N-methyltransferase, H3 lysine-9 specific SUVH5-like [Trifolium pratense]